MLYLRFSKFKCWMDCLIILLTISFVLPQFTWAFELVNAQPNLSVSQPINHFTSELQKKLKNMGDIQSRFQGQEKTIIHIQDLHCNYEVQKNIAGIIHHLASNYNLELVGEEGAFYHVNTTKIRTFPLQQVRDAVSDYFVKQGKLTGAEYYSAKGERPIRLEGIETPELYLKSEQIVQSFLNNESMGYCYDLREVFDGLKQARYSPELKIVDEKRKAFYLGKLELLNYVAFLFQTAKKLKLNPERYPTIIQFFGGQPLRGLVSVDEEQLFLEIDQLDQTIRSKLYTTPEQLELDEQFSRLERMERLLSIAATPEDLLLFKTERDRYHLSVFVAFARALSTETELDIDDGIYRLDDYLTAVEKFYQLADERSVAFVGNLVQKMDRNQHSIAVMITGGFHTRDVLAELERQNISYISIKPIMKRHDVTNPYFALLKKRTTFLEELLAKNQDILALRTNCIDGDFSSNQIVRFDEIQNEKAIGFSQQAELLLEIAGVGQLVKQGMSEQELVSAMRELLANYQADESIGVDLSKLKQVKSSDSQKGYVMVPTTQSGLNTVAVLDPGLVTKLSITLVDQKVDLGNQNVVFYSSEMAPDAIEKAITASSPSRFQQFSAKVQNIWEGQWQRITGFVIRQRVTSFQHLPGRIRVYSQFDEWILEKNLVLNTLKRLPLTVVSFFADNSFRESVAKPITIAERIHNLRARLGEPILGAPLGEVIFSLPVLMGAIWGMGWPMLLITGTAFAGLFTQGHVRASSEEKRILFVFGLILSLITVMPVLFGAPAILGMAYGLNFNVMIHSVYNQLALTRGWPLADLTGSRPAVIKRRSGQFHLLEKLERITRSGNELEKSIRYFQILMANDAALGFSLGDELVKDYESKMSSMQWKKKGLGKNWKKRLGLNSPELMKLLASVYFARSQKYAGEKRYREMKFNSDKYLELLMTVGEDQAVFDHYLRIAKNKRRSFDFIKKATAKLWKMMGRNTAPLDICYNWLKIYEIGKKRNRRVSIRNSVEQLEKFYPMAKMDLIRQSQAALASEGNDFEKLITDWGKLYQVAVALGQEADKTMIQRRVRRYLARAENNLQNDLAVAIGQQQYIAGTLRLKDWRIFLHGVKGIIAIDWEQESESFESDFGKIQKLFFQGNDVLEQQLNELLEEKKYLEAVLMLDDYRMASLSRALLGGVGDKVKVVAIQEQYAGMMQQLLTGLVASEVDYTEKNILFEKDVLLADGKPMIPREKSYPQKISPFDDKQVAGKVELTTASENIQNTETRTTRGRDQKETPAETASHQAAEPSALVPLDLWENIERMEKHYIKLALLQTGNVDKHTAELLGIKTAETVFNKRKKYSGLERETIRTINKNVQGFTIGISEALSGISLDVERSRWRKFLVEEALYQADGDLSQAAADLGMTKKNLQTMIIVRYPELKGNDMKAFIEHRQTRGSPEFEINPNIFTSDQNRYYYYLTLAWLRSGKDNRAAAQLLGISENEFLVWKKLYPQLDNPEQLPWLWSESIPEGLFEADGHQEMTRSIEEDMKAAESVATETNSGAEGDLQPITVNKRVSEFLSGGLDAALDRMERHYLKLALLQTTNINKVAAKLLSIDFSTIYNKYKKYPELRAENIRAIQKNVQGYTTEIRDPLVGISIETERQRLRRHLIREALYRANGDRDQAAADLGITRRALASKIILHLPELKGEGLQTFIENRRTQAPPVLAINPDIFISKQNHDYYYLTLAWQLSEGDNREAARLLGLSEKEFLVWKKLYPQLDNPEQLPWLLSEMIPEGVLETGRRQKLDQLAEEEVISTAFTTSKTKAEVNKETLRNDEKAIVNEQTPVRLSRFNLAEAKINLERYYLTKALWQSGFDKKVAAQVFGLSINAFLGRLKKYQDLNVAHLRETTPRLVAGMGDEISVGFSFAEEENKLVAALIGEAMFHAGWDREQAAASLGISSNALGKLLKRFLNQSAKQLEQSQKNYVTPSILNQDYTLEFVATKTLDRKWFDIIKLESRIERFYLQQALLQSQNSPLKAALLLGLTYDNFHDRRKKYPELKSGSIERLLQAEEKETVTREQLSEGFSLPDELERLIKMVVGEAFFIELGSRQRAAEILGITKGVLNHEVLRKYPEYRMEVMPLFLASRFKQGFPEALGKKVAMLEQVDTVLSEGAHQPAPEVILQPAAVTLDLENTIGRLEKQYVKLALLQSANLEEVAAEWLGIGVSTLQSVRKKYPELRRQTIDLILEDTQDYLDKGVGSRQGISLKNERQALKRRLVGEALYQAGGNRRQAAKLLGIKSGTLKGMIARSFVEYKSDVIEMFFEKRKQTGPPDILMNSDIFRSARNMEYYYLALAWHQSEKMISKAAALLGLREESFEARINKYDQLEKSSQWIGSEFAPIPSGFSLDEAVGGISDTREVVRKRTQKTRTSDVESPMIESAKAEDAVGKAERLAMMVVDQIAAQPNPMTGEALRARSLVLKNEVAISGLTDEALVEGLILFSQAYQAIEGKQLFEYQYKSAVFMVLGSHRAVEQPMGSGKTEVIAAAAYLNALEGKKTEVHVARDYLARIQGERMGTLLNALGITVGIRQNQINEQQMVLNAEGEKTQGSAKDVYACDVIYGKNSIFYGDALYDQIENHTHRRLRPYHYPEVVYVDDAHGPLKNDIHDHSILAAKGPRFNQVGLFKMVAKWMERLEFKEDYFDFDRVRITPSGVGKIKQLENALKKKYGTKSITGDALVTLCATALESKAYIRDQDYIVDPEVGIVLISPSTGELQPFKRWNGYIYEFVSIREKVKKINTSIPFNMATTWEYYRNSENVKVADGRLGEIIYDLNTHLKFEFMQVNPEYENQRKIKSYKLFATQAQKEAAILREVKRLKRQNLPVVIGNRYLNTTKKMRAAYSGESQIFTGTQSREEQQLIIRQAGYPDAITFATIAMGVGADIRSADGNGPVTLILGELLSEEMETQYSGRVGRMEPGVVMRYISLEDDLVVQYGYDVLKTVAAKNYAVSEQGELKIPESELNYFTNEIQVITDAKQNAMHGKLKERWVHFERYKALFIQVKSVLQANGASLKAMNQLNTYWSDFIVRILRASEEMKIETEFLKWLETEFVLFLKYFIGEAGEDVQEEVKMFIADANTQARKVMVKQILQRLEKPDALPDSDADKRLRHEDRMADSDLPLANAMPVDYGVGVILERAERWGVERQLMEYLIPLIDFKLKKNSYWKKTEKEFKWSVASSVSENDSLTKNHLNVLGRVLPIMMRFLSMKNSEAKVGLALDSDHRWLKLALSGGEINENTSSWHTNLKSLANMNAAVDYYTDNGESEVIIRIDRRTLDEVPVAASIGGIMVWLKRPVVDVLYKIITSSGFRRATMVVARQYSKTLILKTLSRHDLEKVYDRSLAFFVENSVVVLLAQGLGASSNFAWVMFAALHLIDFGRSQVDKKILSVNTVLASLIAMLNIGLGFSPLSLFGLVSHLGVNVFAQFVATKVREQNQATKNAVELAGAAWRLSSQSLAPNTALRVTGLRRLIYGTRMHAIMIAPLMVVYGWFWISKRRIVKKQMTAKLQEDTGNQSTLQKKLYQGFLSVFLDDVHFKQNSRLPEFHPMILTEEISLLNYTVGLLRGQYVEASDEGIKIYFPYGLLSLFVNTEPEMGQSEFGIRSQRRLHQWSVTMLFSIMAYAKFHYEREIKKAVQLPWGERVSQNSLWRLANLVLESGVGFFKDDVLGRRIVAPFRIYKMNQIADSLPQALQERYRAEINTLRDTIRLRPRCGTIRMTGSYQGTPYTMLIPVAVCVRYAKVLKTLGFDDVRFRPSVERKQSFGSSL